ncbi:MAG: fibronectin type III domain-containing protein [Gammaproteobacteria bacterium]|nr:fibronectin type III domain-containing protein [Gammaproteobacteria bacterium]
MLAIKRVNRIVKILTARCAASVLVIHSLTWFLPSALAQTPLAPSGLTVTATSNTSISLSWTAPPGEVDAYNLFRCEEGEQACTPEWYVWLEGGETTTYTDDGSADPDADGSPAGLTPGVTYRYAVLAIHYEKIETGPWPEHQGPWSNQVKAIAGMKSQE